MRFIPTWREVRNLVLSNEFGAAVVVFFYGQIAVFFTLHILWALAH